MMCVCVCALSSHARLETQKVVAFALARGQKASRPCPGPRRSYAVYGEKVSPGHRWTDA